ncbi:MAG: ABC transporter permease [Desulfurococcales archaeon]|jgi:ABC-type dipeptide/oligopeptide/nickel transport system permease subunit|nr:ABC transporter permease [Desulfurococcaceae archaeon]MDT7866289.1 ABC transporter permease [Desulfurococcales archaeon]
MEGKMTLLHKVREARRRRIREQWEVFKSNKLAYIGLYILVIMAVISVIGPYIAPRDPYEFDLSKARLPPSLEHPLGTDELGRDILSRILVGARYTFGLSVLSVIAGASIGTLLGLISGYRGGLWDTVIQRVNDILLAFPTILLAIALVAFLGQGVHSLVIAIAVSSMPVYVRLVRASVLQVVTEDYVVAAKMLGLSEWSIMVKHILPNVMAPVLVQLSYHMGLAILIASALGFLGLGVPPPSPEWGAMIGSGKIYLFKSPHIVVFPGLVISITIIAFNMVGDGLRESLDPKVRALVRRL